MKMPVRWRLTRIVVLVAVCVSGLVVVPFGGFVAFSWLYVKWEESHDIPFDLARWNLGSRERIYSETAQRTDAPRIRMCRDFLAHQPWRGKTKAELKPWLGKPDNFPLHPEGDFNYWVGLQRGLMKVDSAWLCSRFDEAGRATDALLKQD
jgi:hypothetical protein